MKLEDLEAKLGIANMGEEEKLALVKDIQANIPALKAEQRVLEAKTQANLVVEAIKKIKEGLEARFDELNGIVDVKVRDITSGKDGLQGPKGDQGDRGFDGVNGKDGYNGKDGIDGVDGKDGVGVQDAYIDFDGSLVIKLTDGTEINVGEVVPMDVAEKIKVIGNGGGTSQSVLDSLTSLQTQINTLTGIDGELGTMAQQNANAVAITGGTATLTSLTTPTVQATNSAGLSLKNSAGTTQMSMGGGGGDNISINVSTNLNGTNAQIDISPTGTGHVHIKPTGVNSVEIAPVSVGDMDNMIIGATTPAAGTFTTLTSTGDTNIGTGLARYLIASGSASGSPGMYATAGSLTFSGGGGAGVNFYSNLFTALQLNIAHTASAVNYVQVTGAATTKGTIISSQGSDSNISSVFQSKGTGAIDLAAGSSGVNISNGGTVTAITGTAGGSSYTSVPSVVISAPTTAGGVQATATVSVQATSSTSVSSGGTGYTVGDVLTVSGGTYATQSQFTVATVSAGVITGITITTAGSYSVVPSSPASVTGGTGSGATLSMLWSVRSGTFVITNAGSGYVEQPTVTFSGGGGSGAAAYASVGSGATIRSIGSGAVKVTNQAFTFETPDSITSGNPVFIIRDSASHDSWYQMGPSSSQAFLVAKGNANASAYLGANGSGSVRFTTNGDSITEQMRVAHTASAVNYVQVTGAATGSTPIISVQGSDAAITGAIQTKGGGSFSFYSQANLTGRQVRIDGSANAVNYLDFYGSVAGSAPSVRVGGSDTNIDLTLTPKGTGNVRFGTYTADMTLVVQGYITIKDSGGTVRKLAVIA